MKQHPITNEPCPKCGGTGGWDCLDSGPHDIECVPCSTCSGTGKVSSDIPTPNLVNIGDKSDTSSRPTCPTCSSQWYDGKCANLWHSAHVTGSELTDNEKTCIKCNRLHEAGISWEELEAIHVLQLHHETPNSGVEAKTEVGGNTAGLANTGAVDKHMPTKLQPPLLNATPKSEPKLHESVGFKSEPSEGMTFGGKGVAAILDAVGSAPTDLPQEPTEAAVEALMADQSIVWPEANRRVEDFAADIERLIKNRQNADGTTISVSLLRRGMRKYLAQLKQGDK